MYITQVNETKAFMSGVVLVFVGRMIMTFFLDKNPTENEYYILFLVAFFNG
jgi:hypothetical protein